MINMHGLHDGKIAFLSGNSWRKGRGQGNRRSCKWNPAASFHHRSHTHMLHVWLQVKHPWQCDVVSRCFCHKLVNINTGSIFGPVCSFDKSVKFGPSCQPASFPIQIRHDTRFTCKVVWHFSLSLSLSLSLSSQHKRTEKGGQWRQTLRTAGGDPVHTLCINRQEFLLPRSL